MTTRPPVVLAARKTLLLSWDVDIYAFNVYAKSDPSTLQTPPVVLNGIRVVGDNRSSECRAPVAFAQRLSAAVQS